MDLTREFNESFVTETWLLGRIGWRQMLWAVVQERMIKWELAA